MKQTLLTLAILCSLCFNAVNSFGNLPTLDRRSLTGGRWLGTAVLHSHGYAGQNENSADPIYMVFHSNGTGEYNYLNIGTSPTTFKWSLSGSYLTIVVTELGISYRLKGNVRFESNRALFKNFTCETFMRDAWGRTYWENNGGNFKTIVGCDEVVDEAFYNNSVNSAINNRKTGVVTEKHFNEFDTLNVNGVSLVMCKIKGGVVNLNCGGTFVRSRISDFQIGQTEVTEKLWDAVMGTNNARQDADYPKAGVSWHDCMKFIEKLNQLTGRTFNLPTECQWLRAAEYCRPNPNHPDVLMYESLKFAEEHWSSELKTKKYGGSEFHVFVGSEDLNRVGWYNENSGNTVHPVAQKMRNTADVYDMSGNVFEWCRDWFETNYGPDASVDEFQGAQHGDRKVARGGSWNTGREYCMIITRHAWNPNDRPGDCGLRLVLEN